MKSTYGLIVGLMVVSIGLLLAVFLINSDKRHDNQTENDLRALNTLIVEKIRKNENYETNPEAYNLGAQFNQRATERKYEIKKGTQTSQPRGLLKVTYELCADFRTDTTETAHRHAAFPGKHTQGQHCFEQTVSTTNRNERGRR